MKTIDMGETLFYDPLFGQYFMSKIGYVLEVQARVNESEGWVYSYEDYGNLVNCVREKLGLTKIPDMYFKYLFNVSDEKTESTINMRKVSMRLEARLRDDGMPCIDVLFDLLEEEENES